MSRSTTLKDVAEAAGVSISTTSRALADNPAISEETRRRIKKLAKQLNYRPNAQARALRKSKTNTIGVAVPSLINPYYAEMATSIQQEAAARGFATIIANTNENPDELRRSLQVLHNQRVDGMIIVPNEGTEDLVEELHTSGVPVVAVDRELAIDGLICVVSDPSRGMNAAVKHLAEHGHTPIGYLSGPMSTSTGRKRLEAFHEACAEAGLPEQPVYVGGYRQSEGRMGATELLGQGVKALLAGDSMMTIGAIEACEARGIEIGVDIAVIGFDNYPLFELLPKPITIIDQDVAAMAIRALDLVRQQIEEPNRQRLDSTVKGKISTPTQLIVRASSDFDAPATAGGAR